MIGEIFRVLRQRNSRVAKAYAGAGGKRIKKIIIYLSKSSQYANIDRRGTFVDKKLCFRIHVSCERLSRATRCCLERVILLVKFNILEIAKIDFIDLVLFGFRRAGLGYHSGYIQRRCL